MTRLLATLLRWACDPAKLEALAGDLEELYGQRFNWRCLPEVLSVCVRHSRLITMNHRPILSLVTVTMLLVLTGSPSPPPLHFIVNAVDPAGAFTLEVRDRSVVAATLDGRPVEADHLVQTGDTLVIKRGDRGRDFVIAITPRGIAWTARQAPRRP